MLHSVEDLVATSDFRLIVLSVLISFIGSYTAIDIAEQIPIDSARSRQFWLIGSGIVLGLTIWAMHFTGILAHTLPIPVGYNFLLLLLSVAIAINGSIIGVWIANQFEVWWILGAVMIGSTIIAMHYISMAALQMAARQVYDLPLVLVSGVIAIAGSLGGFWLLRFRENNAIFSRWRQVIGSAGSMGIAISGMHYGAMIATHIRAATTQSPQIEPISSRVLAIVIGVAALLILTGALLASFFGRQLTAERARIEALQITEAQLEELVRQRTKELEQEKFASEAASQAKSAFLSNTSHELRTPLTAIIGFSSVLLEQVFGALTPRQLQYVQQISDAGYQLLALINDLLDLAKAESGREVVEIGSVSVEAVCQACFDTLQGQAEHRGLAFSYAIEAGITTCTADERRVTQILLNLLANAIKFTEVGSVTLSVRQVESSIEFEICDTGIGIAPIDREKLFQPFQQLDQGLARKYQGTGLGLALSQKLAQLQGGEITVKSTIGEGSCFTLHLPQESRSLG
ncbi:sensor histidine kinase [Leptolyngbya sp. NIES-2104]|uniref:sensor histidine kinase n=1 Tax=Leptolyngbya sp. NIES-2104 TaxID=1552121 RepID=UPI0006ECA957|nr:MHYT domain-containing protein [Leptolyngbya sp. NIES-2104]GAP95741.1 circadian input kinase A [Leptolyngbya sp. NIES-2104]